MISFKETQINRTNTLNLLYILTFKSVNNSERKEIVIMSSTHTQTPLLCLNVSFEIPFFN